MYRYASCQIEIKIVLEEFAKRVDAFSISDESKIKAHGGTTMGMIICLSHGQHKSRLQNN